MFGAIRNFAVLTLLTVNAQAVAADTQSERQHSVREISPNAASSGATTQYQLPALNDDKGIRKSRDAASRKTTARINDAFFVSLDLVLDGDFDADGHYYVIDLTWDADTAFALLDVYAVMWLSFEGGPWEEFLTTDVYTLSGDSSLDSYQIESELQRGYPTGYYDILLELYDPVSGELLAEIGPADSAVLDEIPLEDADRDAYHSDDHYGGGLGIYSIIAVAGLGYYRRRRSYHRLAAKL
jgi:hypothetical protein